MKRKLFRAIPVAALAAAAVAGAVLLWTQPWSGGAPVQEAIAQPAEYGFCSVFISDVPSGVHLTAFRIPDHLIDHIGAEGILQAYVPSPDGDPEATPDVSAGSSVSVDAQTGEITHEEYRSPADEAKLEVVLVRLRVGPWQPAAPAWPRTDTEPTGQTEEIHERSREPTDSDQVMLTYREPEPGSGLLANQALTNRPDGRMYRSLFAYTCDSLIEVDAETGKVVRKEVVPEEEAMFQRFLDEVETPLAVEAEGRP